MDYTQTTQQLSALLVFAAGLLSFFSPCVIPLLPVYLSLLTASDKSEKDSDTGDNPLAYSSPNTQATPDENLSVSKGNSYTASNMSSNSSQQASAHPSEHTGQKAKSSSWANSRAILNTIGFVLGISAAFFLLGLAFTGLGQLFAEHRSTLIKIGALIILILGIWMLLPTKPMATLKEKRFYLKRSGRVNPAVAFLMGFFFSFAWTPCVGPLLSAALILASSAEHASTGFLYIAVYTLGFIIPFVLVSLVSQKILSWLRGRGKLLRTLNIAAGILMILIALSMFTGWFNVISNKLSQFQGISLSQSEKTSLESENTSNNTQNTASDKGAATNTPAADAGRAASDTPGTPEYERAHPMAPEFSLTDQYGTTHTLSELRGKVVLINFWATWCPPCRKEMPDIQRIYLEYKDKDDVVILGIANPRTEDNQQNADVSIDEIKKFLKDGGYSFPVGFDTSGQTLLGYRVSAFPTTYIINQDGRIEGYIPGATNYETLRTFIERLRK